MTTQLKRTDDQQYRQMPHDTALAVQIQPPLLTIKDDSDA